MEICATITAIRRFVRAARQEGKTVGFVPTMGYLHEGHLALVRRAKAECDAVVVSIFVNPLQFGPAEDFARYPRDPERDLRLCRETGVDAVFIPADEEMYPSGYCTYVEVSGTLTSCLCGASRPGHFKGVATVVTKLFNIVQPHRAYFGAKDYQQALVIERLVEDLNFDLEIIVVPTVRESDGLAMSSRNVYLQPEERRAATVLYRSLQAAQEMVAAGERDVATIVERVREMITAEPLATIDYVEIRRLPDLAEITTIEGRALLALAVRIGKARLIDNIELEA